MENQEIAGQKTQTSVYNKIGKYVYFIILSLSLLFMGVSFLNLNPCGPTIGEVLSFGDRDVARFINSFVAWGFGVFFMLGTLMVIISIFCFIFRKKSAKAFFWKGLLLIIICVVGFTSLSFIATDLDVLCGW